MKYRIHPGRLEIIIETLDGISDLGALFERLCLSRKDRYLYLQEGRISSRCRWRRICSGRH